MDNPISNLLEILGYNVRNSTQRLRRKENQYEDVLQNGFRLISKETDGSISQNLMECLLIGHMDGSISGWSIYGEEVREFNCELQPHVGQMLVLRELHWQTPSRSVLYLRQRHMGKEAKDACWGIWNKVLFGCTCTNLVRAYRTPEQVASGCQDR